MAEFYNIPYKALCTRLKRKWSLKRALTTPIHNCTDHLGNAFESRKAMAEFYNIPYLLLNRRLEREWSLERALTTPNGKPRGKYVHSCIDHLGNEFESRKAMAEFYSVPHRVLNRRLERGWNIKRALTTPVHNCTDHLGNTFESRKAMAEFYHIPYLLLNRRLAREWDIKRALTTPNGKPRGKYTKSKA